MRDIRISPGGTLWDGPVAYVSKTPRPEIHGPLPIKTTHSNLTAEYDVENQTFSLLLRRPSEDESGDQARAAHAAFLAIANAPTFEEQVAAIERVRP